MVKSLIPRRNRPLAMSSSGNSSLRKRPPSSPSRRIRLIPETLRARLALTYAVLVIVIMGVLGVYLAIVARNLYVERLSEQLAGEARLVADATAPLVRAGAGIAEMEPVATRLGQLLGARVTIVAADGTVVGESSRDPTGMENHGSRPEVLAARRGAIGAETRHSATLDEDYLYVAVAVADTNGAVARVALPLNEVDAAVRRVQRDVAAAMVIALTLVVAVGLFIASRIAGPLDDLRLQAQSVAAGRLGVAVEPAATRELGELGRAFNAMTRQLRTSRQELDRVRLRLEVTLANLSDGVIITDAHGAVLRLNGAADRMLGLSGASVTGWPFVQVSRDHELAALLRDVLSGEDDSPRVAVVEHGRSRRVLEATAQQLAGTGERLGLVVLRDVTELRRLERVRREFVANVSHELRTPLSSIKAVVETLEAGAIDDPDVSGEFLHRIVGEVDRLAALVDELLDLGRLESGRVTLQREALAPDDLLIRATERLRPQTQRARLTLEVVVPPDLPPVRADRGRIEQVVLNLVHNAIKFTPPGGVITISATRDDSMVRIVVQDTGVGLSEAELPRLFERFYKADRARRSDGTGLGLAIAKHIVQAHGGSIWAESRPGQGAEFSFTLPTATVDGDASGDAGAAAALRGATAVQSEDRGHLGAHRRER